MIRRLLILSGIAIVGAVLYHSTGWGYTAMFWWPHRYLPVTSPNFDQLGSLSYYGIRAIEQFVSFGVAAFLFVSGSFVAIATGRNQKTVGWKVVGSRISALLVPYLIWSLVIFALEIMQGRVLAPADYLLSLLVGRTTPHYYFVPLLVQLYLLAPLLVLVAKRQWKWFLIGTALIQFFVTALNYMDTLALTPDVLQPLKGMTRSWFFAGNIFWFSLGIAVGMNLQPVKAWLERVRWWLLATVVVLFPICIVEWELVLRYTGEQWIAPRFTPLDFLYAASFILCFMAFNRVSIPYSKEFGDLAPRTFGIYLVHSPVLEFSARLIYTFAPWLMAYQIIFLPLLAGLGIGVPIALMRLVNLKHFPMRRSYRFLFG